MLDADFCWLVFGEDFGVLISVGWCLKMIFGCWFLLVGVTGEDFLDADFCWLVFGEDFGVLISVGWCLKKIFGCLFLLVGVTGEDFVGC